MRVFIGSSGEQVRLVEWLTGFISGNYHHGLTPVPWTIPWPGGQYTLENLLGFVDDTDAAILFWTADDKTWYRDTRRQEPRDNLVFEAGLFMAGHGRERTQLMVPQYPQGDERGEVAIPSDVAGLTWNPYPWRDGAPESTGLPVAARTVCDRLAALGSRQRPPTRFPTLVNHDRVDLVSAFVGDWTTINNEVAVRLAGSQVATSIDILAAYRVGEIRRALDSFRTKPVANLRACFANMWDDALANVYLRKFHDRSTEYMRKAVEESIQQLLGPSRVEVVSPSEIRVLDMVNPPAAHYQIRLTSQRITFGYYRVDDAAVVVPLDMKRAQNPAPPAWAIDRETAPRVFDRYLGEFAAMFDEALRVYPL
jgi:hypothetical protein